MKGVAFVTGTFDRRIDEAKVEKGIVSDQYRAFAGAGLDRGTDGTKDLVERFSFRQSTAKRVTGIDAVELQCLWIEVGTFEGHHMAADGFRRFEIACIVHAQNHCSDFQQRIRLGIETRGLDIDHDWEIAAKALAYRGIVLLVFHRMQDTQCAPG